MHLNYGDILFEWDDRKNCLNQKKHGISFQEAAHVFFDENRVELYDAEHSNTENRYITIGAVQHILLVIYTEHKDSLRIISARIADKEERKMYYGNSQNDY